MNTLTQFSGEVTWRELLSSDEIRAWAVDRKTPIRLGRKRLPSELAYPGVYRFIFPEKVDGSAKHTPFYVGEGGDVGKRLRAHFAPSSDEEKRDAKGAVILDAGWQVRGSIQNSHGKFSLQILNIEGSFNLCGVILNQHSFDDPFARKLLENWAILSSERLDKLHKLNRGISASNKNFARSIQAASRVRQRAQ